MQKKDVWREPIPTRCVDFILEYSKAKNSVDEQKACKHHEDVLFSHLEGGFAEISRSEKIVDLNIIVAMSLFQFNLKFAEEIIVDICESEPSLLRYCYIAYATLDGLGIKLERKVVSFVWDHFLTSPVKAVDLQFMGSVTSLSAMSDIVTTGDSEQLLRVMNQLVKIIFTAKLKPESASEWVPTVTDKRRALAALSTYCDRCDSTFTMTVLQRMGDCCVNDDVLSSCIVSVPGLISFLSKALQSTTQLSVSTSIPNLYLWSHGTCRGVSQVCMQLALSLDSLVYDLVALSSTDPSMNDKSTTELSEFISLEIRVVQLLSALANIKLLYKTNDKSFIIDQLSIEERKVFIQSENIIYSSIQRVLELFPMDKSDLSSVWQRIQLVREPDDGDTDVYGPNHHMRMCFAFSALITTCIKYLVDGMTNHLHSQYFSHFEALNAEFPDKSTSHLKSTDPLWISDSSCLDLSWMWIRTMVQSSEVNIKASGLGLCKFFLEALSFQYVNDTLISMRSLSNGSDMGVQSIDKFRSLVNIRQRINGHLGCLLQQILLLIKKDKITDIDSLRVALDLIVQYGAGVVASLPESDAAVQSNLAIKSSATQSSHFICSAQSLLLFKAGQSPETAAENGIASSSLEEEIKYYTVRRLEFTRSLCLISHQLFVLSLSAVQCAAPDDFAKLMHLENTGVSKATIGYSDQRKPSSLLELWSSAVPSQTLHNSVENVMNSPSTLMQSEIDHSGRVSELLRTWQLTGASKGNVDRFSDISSGTLTFWDSIIDADDEFDQSVLLQDSSLTLSPEIMSPHSNSETKSSSPLTPLNKSHSEEISAIASPAPASTGLMSGFSFSNLLNRHYVNVSVLEQLVVKCDGAGNLISGIANGTLSVSSKLSDTSVTKCYCNIKDPIIFIGTGPRHSGLESITVANATVNTKLIRSTEFNGLFFITSQPGSSSETTALEYHCNLTGLPPLQVIIDSSAVVDNGEKNDSGILGTAAAPMVSGGEIDIVVHSTYTFRNTCSDRDIIDISVDFKLPECKTVTSCVVESTLKSKDSAKYDISKRALFTRIHKLKRGMELVLKVSMKLHGIKMGMLQTENMVNNSPSLIPDSDRMLSKQRGFYVTISPSHVSFSITNEKITDPFISKIKFELPSGLGSQQGNVNRSIAASTVIKSYSCLTPDLFVRIPRRKSISKGDTSVSTTSDEHDLVVMNEATVEILLVEASVRDDNDPPSRLKIVSESTLFLGMKASGIEPPIKPTYDES